MPTFSEEILQPTVCIVPKSSTAYEDIRKEVQTRYQDKAVETRAIILALAYTRYSRYKKLGINTSYSISSRNNHVVFDTVISSARSEFTPWIESAVVTFDKFKIENLAEAISSAENRIDVKLAPVINTFNAQFGSKPLTQNIGRLAIRAFVFPFVEGIKHAVLVLVSAAWLTLLVYVLSTYTPIVISKAVHAIEDDLHAVEVAAPSPPSHTGP